MRRGEIRREDKKEKGCGREEEERRAQAHSASTCKLRAWGKHKRNSVAKRTRSLWIHCLLGPEQQGPLDAVSDSSPSD